MTVIAWGGTGASVAWLTWSCARAGSVQGFPPGHYGPGVLDEHKGGPGPGGRSRLSAAATVKPNAGQAKSFSPGKPHSGTDGNDKAPAGRGDRATSFYFRRHGLAPRFPTLILSLSKDEEVL
jgi:hypothetical protein